MSDLLPCPHCGAAPLDYAIEPHAHSPWLVKLGMPETFGGSHVVECPACGNGMINEDRARVLERWNRRAIAAAPAHPPAALPDGWFMTAMYLVKRYAVAAHNGHSDMEFLYQSLRDHLRLAEGR